MHAIFPLLNYECAKFWPLQKVKIKVFTLQWTQYMLKHGAIIYAIP